VLRDRAYVTGLSTSGEYDMWEYEPVGNSWTRKADYPGGCGVRGTAFSTGGYGYVGFGYSSGAACQDIWRYEPFADSWTPAAAFPGPARHEALGFSDGLLDAPVAFVAAGSDGARDPNYLTDMWTYDPAGEAWTQVPTAYPGKGRVQMTAGILDGRLFMGLGADNDFGSDRFDDWWEYVPDE
jgi:N-acetylneuraminic acid mutarotase